MLSLAPLGAGTEAGPRLELGAGAVEQGCCWEALAPAQRERGTGPDLGRQSVMLRSSRFYAVADGEALKCFSKGRHTVTTGGVKHLGLFTMAYGEGR